MKRELLDLAADLSRRAISFVVGTAVRGAGRGQGHVGDAVIITAIGSYHGELGGAAQRASLEAEAAQVLVTGEPRLVVVRLPTLDDEQEGTIEVYLDPVLATPRLLLVGRSLVLTSLAMLARAIGYQVDHLEPDAEDALDDVESSPSTTSGVVVAAPSVGADRTLANAAAPGRDRRMTLLDLPRNVGPVMAVMVLQGGRGGRDQHQLERILAMHPMYVGVIASRRRFALVREALAQRDEPTGAEIERIVNPAGLALGAHDPGELAIGILAQMIARRHGVVTVNEGAVSAGDGSIVTSTLEVTMDSSRRTAPARGIATAAATASCFPAAIDARPDLTVPLRVRASSPAMGRGGAAELVSPSAVPVRADDATDPVCQQVLETADARYLGTWDGRTWYFCCAACKYKFFANPLRYSAFAAPVM